MNLGEVVPLTESEARFFHVRNVHGRVLNGVYAAPAASLGDRSALGNRTLTFSQRLSASQTQASVGGATEDFCEADVHAERTPGGGPRGRWRDQPALAPRRFEHEVAALHKPRVLAARVAPEEAELLYRKGSNPDEGMHFNDDVLDISADPIR